MTRIGVTGFDAPTEIADFLIYRLRTSACQSRYLGRKPLSKVQNALVTSRI